VTWLPFSNIGMSFGLDGFSLLLVLLTGFLTPICLLLSWNFSVESNLKQFNIAFLVLESILFGVFCSLDILVFYVFFEAVLIPMYFVIGVFGSKKRRVRASYLLFLYTLFSSMFMFIAILMIYLSFGTTDYQTLKTVQFDPFFERFCWFAFFLSFAVKMPLLPFHVWLPEAHSEAPTAGSVILAGVLLKLGGFGFLRYSVGMFPEASAFFTPFIFSVSVFGVIYASITTLQQVDLKKIIAYSSVGHMALVTIGIFSCNSQGILGSILLMLSHGIVSAALFLCVGILYERHQTRIIRYYSGLIHTMPLFSVFFFCFSLANIGLPGTVSFIGEFLVFVGCFEINSLAALLSGSGLILGAGYGLWLLNRLLLGNSKILAFFTLKDLTRYEFFMLLPFLLLTLVLGLFPSFLITYITVY
jgi:proton-translocating NADH-quinone oxidoreductase chain M